MSKDNELILVGRLGRTRGVRGHLWITPLTDFPDRFLDLEEILVGGNDSWDAMTIESSQMMNDRPLIKFAGIDTREEAARLTNRDLAVRRDELIELEPDEHYVFDLIGCEVFGPDDENKLGDVVDVRRYPANDVYVVRTPDAGEVFYPAVRGLVESIDTENKKIVVKDASLFDSPDRKKK